MSVLDSVNLRTRWGRYLLMVLGPSALACAYLAVWASDGFVSRAEIMIEQESNLAASGAELALGLLSAGGGRSKQDALLVERYMNSRTLFELLDRELDLKGHFSDPQVDWLSRLSKEASREDMLDFYRDNLLVSIDESSLIISVEFTAHDADYAQRVAQKLVEHSEVFINEVSRNLAGQQLEFAQTQVESAHERVKLATRELIVLQQQNAVFSPEQESQALGEILVGLEVELAKQRTQLKTLAGYLNPQAPDVEAVKQRIDALEAQVQQERQRLVGQHGTGLNELMLAYQDAEVNLKLAAELYKAALAALETSRLDATRKVKFLVSVDKPSLPDSAEHPRVLYWTITIFVMLNLLYFVANLIVATIQDHRE